MGLAIAKIGKYKEKYEKLESENSFNILVKIQDDENNNLKAENDNLKVKTKELEISNQYLIKNFSIK